jgi:hypothetical protein
MQRYAIMMLVGAALVGSSCGGDGPTVIPSPAPPTTTLPTQPSPSPAPSASPVAQNCTFAPGPVARFAIAPRQLQTDGPNLVPMFVRARANWDEVICLDKDKTHRLDFNANQRNADGQECCYEGDANWRVVEDSSGMIVNHQSFNHPDNMVYRFTIDPRGRADSFAVEAELDGVLSHPWQSGSGYRREPFRVVTMSANDIARECLCIYRGNGVYEGARCSK